MKNINKLFIISLIPFLLGTSCKTHTPTTQPSDNYQLVWQDEFDYTGLPDSSKWEYDTAGNKSGWGNHELEYYTFGRKENVWVDSGTLKIKALHEKFMDKDYTSARLITSHKGDWLYGKIEVRAKIPNGLGAWPAIWMMPTDDEYGGWPESGEIDIMELVGYKPDTVFATVHTDLIGSQSTRGILVENPADSFHVYEMDWQKDTINMFVDGKKYFSFTNNNSGYKEWPFDKRFHLLLNIAVGGDWGGQKGVDNSTLPYIMEVDYVRVYQR